MNPTIMTFPCPACGVRLQLPSAMAGVRGPCPRCGTMIEAPPAAIPAVPAAPAMPAVPAAPPVSAEVPLPGPARLSSPLPTAATAPEQAVPALPVPPAAEAAASGVAAREPAAIPAADERRRRTSDASGRGPASKAEGPWVRTTKSGGQPEGGRQPASRADRHRASAAAPRAGHSWLLRAGVPLLFLLACSGIFFGTFQLLNPKPPPPVPPVSSSAIRPSSGSGLLPVTTSPGPPTGPLPDQGKPPAGNAATDALARFLAAPDLDGRMDDLLSDRSREQLAATCLAGKLPEPAIPNLDQQIHLQGERLTEYHFTVEFPEAKPPQPRVVKVLVHQRGEDGRPLVLADPFLDLFDGRLLEFGKAPAQGLRTFHAVVEAMPRCDDPRVPEAEKKIALRLLANDVPRDDPNRSEAGKILAVAHAGRLSTIGEKLESGTSGLNWGRPQTCVVTLQWNARDDPQRPYLEAVQIDSLNWNR